MTISFDSVTIDDLPLIHKWFNKPHVQEFYSLRQWTEKEVIEKLKPSIHGEKAVFVYLIRFSNKPIGYIQYYRVDQYPWPEQDLGSEIIKNAAGIDIFIGDEDFIGKGLGSPIIEEFLRNFIWPRFRYCIVDPDVRNAASIRLFEKSGFHIHKKIKSFDTLNAPVELQLMIKQNPVI